MDSTNSRRATLSVIDVQWPGDMPTLVPAVERWGYCRYLTTEHHSPRQSGSPTLLAALAATLTTRLRVGTAAVLLSFTSPLRVAEDFRLLDLFFPGRFDLGVAGGGTTGTARAHLLDGRPEPDVESFARKVEEVACLLHPTGGADTLDGVDAGPRSGRSTTGPEIWVCGMSPRSAVLAGRLGLSFAYSEHMRRNTAGTGDGVAVLLAYRQARNLAAPGRTSITCYGICAKTAARAERLWSEYCASHRKQLAPTFLGTPEDCRQQLEEVARRFQADELAVQSICDDLESRLESYRLLGAAWGLSQHADPTAEADRGTEPGSTWPGRIWGEATRWP